VKSQAVIEQIVRIIGRKRFSAEQLNAVKVSIASGANDSSILGAIAGLELALAIMEESDVGKER
jgi:hypothetical protein